MNLNPFPTMSVLAGQAVSRVINLVRLCVSQSVQAFVIAQELVTKLDADHLKAMIDLCTARLAVVANATSEVVENVAEAVEAAAPLVNPGAAPVVKAACDVVEAACDQVQAATGNT